MLQLLSILGLTYLQSRKATDSPSRTGSAKASREEERPLLTNQNETPRPSVIENGRGDRLDHTTKVYEVWRGRIFMTLCAMSIALTWALFLGTAWFRLGKAKDGHKAKLN